MRFPAFAITLLLSLLARAVAADTTTPAATGVARPSVEELATPPEPQKPSDAPDGDTREAICLMVESAARANDLPLEFFARLIWQESRFQADAVGPTTRSGERAQGIAQFMPGTGRRASRCSIPSIPCRRCRNRRSS